MHMENLDRFGPCQIILDHFYTLGFFGPFGPFWTVLDHSGPFGPFWTVWTILDCLDHSGPFANGSEWSTLVQTVKNGPKRSRIAKNGLEQSKWEIHVNGRFWPKNEKSDLAGRGPDFQDLPKLVVEYVNLHIGP